MEPQFGLASSDDIWRLQNEMKNVYATQAELADRLGRLERRQDDDAHVKSVWGGQSPFPSLLNGASQQGTQISFICGGFAANNRMVDTSYNPAAEAFKNFDQDQTNGMLDSLHLDADDEPRRGASRANSVRFDETALQTYFGHASRSSTDFISLRTGSAIGSHPMTERSSSHKSDGKQSSAQSIQSARANSFGYESRPLSANVPSFVPLGPPPGLFILGPVPSIIRCWLDTKFSNESLLYAAVCTGSYQSILSNDLVLQLGLEDRITINHQGDSTIKIPVYLPEATIQQPSSHTASPTPRLPTITVEFLVLESTGKADVIQIFLGCDVLRAQNADIHFSLDRMTLFDDERNKVAIPLVRPERTGSFRCLRTVAVDLGSSRGTNNAISPRDSDELDADREGTHSTKQTVLNKANGRSPEQPKPPSASEADSSPNLSPPSVIGEGRKSAGTSEKTEKLSSTNVHSDDRDAQMTLNSTTHDNSARSEGASIWGSWRRDTAQNGRHDTHSSPSIATISGYQRAGRGKGMKVLKPARLNTSRSISTDQAPIGFNAAPSRFGDGGKGPILSNASEYQPPTGPATLRSASVEKTPTSSSLPSKPRTSNPVGGASAFGWLNSNGQKQSPVPHN